MRLYIIRHGSPDYDNDCLTADGRREAALLAERLAGEGLTDLFCSPLGRAQETMRYTAERLGLPGTVEPWLEELTNVRVPDPLLEWSPHVMDISGIVVRRLAQPVTLDAWHIHPPLDDPIILERVRRVQAGSDEFMARHGYVPEDGIYRLEAANRRRMAFFCHNGSGLAWLAHLLHIPVPLIWSGFFLHPASVTTVLLDERHPNYAAPRCLGVGDTGHLYQAGAMPRPVGLKANYD